MSFGSKLEIAAALLIVALIGWLLIARSNLTAQLATARGDAAALQIANDGFRDAAQRQMQALNDIQAAAAMRAHQARIAEQRADKRAERYEAAARALTRVPAPGDACQTAERLIDLYRRGAP